MTKEVADKKEYIPTEEEYNAWIHRYREVAEKTIDEELKRSYENLKFDLIPLGIMSVSSTIATVVVGVGLGEWVWQVPAIITAVSSIPTIFDARKYFNKKKYREKNIRDYEKDLNESASLAPPNWRNWGKVR